MEDMSTSLAPASGAHHHRLVEAGFEIARARGIGALSARGLAERLRISGSAMNYHFGNRDHLLAAVLERAGQESEAWRLGQAAALASLAPWTTTPDIFLAVIQSRLETARDLQILLFEFAAQASRHDFLFPAAKAETQADGAYWRGLARATGASEADAVAWADLSVGLRLLFCPEADATLRAAWMSGALARLAARLAGAKIAPTRASAAPDAATRLEAQAPRTETAARIVEAALRVIAVKGAEGMSQRDVAAVAGVSQASVTYFHRTRADLITAAASALHREIQTGVLSEAERTGGPTRWARQVIDDAGNFRWRVGALHELMLMSARDATLAPIARELRATGGATAMGLLRAQGVADLDQLDAFMWSTLLRGATETVRFLPAAARRSAFETRTRQYLASVFKIEDTEPGAPSPLNLNPVAPG
jgi:AcrR family transcriptional regulator